MVSTLEFESSDPSSNLGRTLSMAVFCKWAFEEFFDNVSEEEDTTSNAKYGNSDYDYSNLPRG